MYVNDRRIFAIALVLVALMSIFVPAASAAGSQDWYLCSSNTLSKTGPGSGSHSLGAGGPNWEYWTAGPAQCDLTMGAGTWHVDLAYTPPCAGDFCMEVCNKKASGDVILAGHYWYGVSGTSSSLSVDMNSPAGDSKDFKLGEQLALKLGWYPDTGSSAIQINYGSGTKVTSPTTDPGYPVPELSTLALYSVGLLALAGYVVYRRRRI